MATDYFDAALALDPTSGNVVADAQAEVFDIGDTDFASPLAITDLTGISITPLVASPTGIYPPFRVVSGATRVLVKSGEMVTPLTSVDGLRGEPGEAGAPGIGLPSATNLPNGYVPVTASGVWTASPAPSGGGGGGSSSILEVYWISGTGWPTLPATAPAGVRARWFIGGPTVYTGDTWDGVIDMYFAGV